MIDHISVGTNDIARARAFYDAVLAELAEQQRACREYDAHYYGGFVFDPDGNKIEAVTRSSR